MNKEEPELHDVYQDQELINVRMRVKDYNTLMKMIERERSMHIVWKYVLTIAGAGITVVTFFQLEIWKKLFG